MQSAESYLTDGGEEGEATDAESVITEKSNTESELSSNYGKLKHSDSLLLLTQVRGETLTCHSRQHILCRLFVFYYLLTQCARWLENQN